MTDFSDADTEPQPLRPDTPASGGPAIARQPIVDQAGNVFGYELFDRSRPSDAHDAASDAQLLFNVLSQADNTGLIDNRTLFINCAHDSLASGHLELVQPERVVLEIPPVPGNQPAEIERRLSGLRDARKRGLRLAFNQSVLTAAYLSWLPLANFIKIDLRQVKPERVEPMVALAQKKTQARLIMEKVENAAQHQLARDLCVTLFQGYWFAQPTMVTGQSIRPSQAVIIQLIDLVRQQASTAQIEAVLKHDASLSFNLLRFINASGFGLTSEITSFRHAVMMLGLKKLFRWAALLLTTSRDGGAPPAVGTTAIVRGRLMELLAIECKLPEEQCDNAFVTGVFSLLDAMLGMPMDTALEAVALPDAVTSALLRQRGPLAPLLALCVACESGDDEAFARTAATLQLDNQQINWAHLQALAWAETMSA
ncbi:MAG: HDOD domain-containing protein [Rhodoferax sp.]|nr:HDOD domain-containing protein [Rhodoferax sp.]